LVETLVLFVDEAKGPSRLAFGTRYADDVAVVSRVVVVVVASAVTVALFEVPVGWACGCQSCGGDAVVVSVETVSLTAVVADSVIMEVWVSGARQWSFSMFQEKKRVTHICDGVCFGGKSDAGSLHRDADAGAGQGDPRSRVGNAVGHALGRRRGALLLLPELAIELGDGDCCRGKFAVKTVVVEVMVSVSLAATTSVQTVAVPGSCQQERVEEIKKITYSVAVTVVAVVVKGVRPLQ
jgi:hypothetical protein